MSGYATTNAWGASIPFFAGKASVLLDQSLPAFIGHNLDKIGDGTVL